MQSRIHAAVLKWKADQGEKGGRGRHAPSTFVRLPLNVLSELDDIIDGYKERYGDFPESPRNKRLFELIAELEDLLPSTPKD